METQPIKQYLETIIRAVVAMGIGRIVGEYFSADAIVEIVSLLSGLIAVIVWGFISKYFDKQKEIEVVKTALDMPEGSTVRQLEKVLEKKAEFVEKFETK